MDAGPLLLIVIILSLTLIIVLILHYSHKQRMALIKSEEDISKRLKEGNKKLVQILFVAGMFSIAVFMTGFFGWIVQLAFDSFGPEWNPEDGGPRPYRDIGYEAGFFLWAGLSLLFSFYKIRQWNKQDKLE
jgi:ABC-type Fe3+ transport system permease subunit